MDSLQLLFPSGTRWNLSLHTPTVTAPIPSTWRARATRFFSPYFPALCRSLYLSLYCEILAKDSICGYRESRGGGERGGTGTGEGEGWDFQSLRGRRLASHAGIGLGPAPSHMPYTCARYAIAPRTPPLQRAGAANGLRMPLATCSSSLTSLFI
jgi:hypothetical protein